MACFFVSSYSLFKSCWQQKVPSLLPPCMHGYDKVVFLPLSFTWSPSYKQNLIQSCITELSFLSFSYPGDNVYDLMPFIHRQKIPLENPLENPLEDDVIGGHGFLSEDLDESGHPISLVSVDHIIASDNISEIVKVFNQ